MLYNNKNNVLYSWALCYKMCSTFPQTAGHSFSLNQRTQTTLAGLPNLICMSTFPAHCNWLLYNLDLQQQCAGVYGAGAINPLYTPHMTVGALKLVTPQFSHRDWYRPMLRFLIICKPTIFLTHFLNKDQWPPMTDQFSFSRPII